jgi:hypothetical protein
MEEDFLERTKRGDAVIVLAELSIWPRDDNTYCRIVMVDELVKVRAFCGTSGMVIGNIYVTVTFTGLPAV